MVNIIAQEPFTPADLAGWLSHPVQPRPQQKAMAQKQKTAEQPTQRTAAQITAVQRRMRILAAEDNKTNRLVFGKMLKALNVDLHFACDGQEAVEAYETFRPDLIFMDISMPRLDGKEATRAIRTIEAGTGAHVPIVALTAHAMAGDDRDILEAGLDKYLTKPLRKKEILAQIADHCPQDALPPCPQELDQAV
jgi:CheY-like chemotaxis protein